MPSIVRQKVGVRCPNYKKLDKLDKIDKLGPPAVDLSPHSTQLYQISLLSGYGNLAQGGNLIQGGGRLQTVLQGPRLTKSSAFFCKSHLPLLIPGWKTKNYHPKTLFWSQKRSIFLGFHEFPKMGVTCSSNPHFRKFVILLLLLMPGLLQWF